MKGGGKNKQERLYLLVSEYISQSQAVFVKAKQTLSSCDSLAASIAIEHYLNYVTKLQSLLSRRILQAEPIPQEDKIYSIFEPHTHWIVKGKSGVICELGQKMLITTDQNNFIVDWQLNDNQSDVNITSEIVKRMQEQYNGNVSSHSFDKGFSKQSVNQELRKAYPQTNLVIKKKGKCNKTEREIESELEFRTLYNQHNAIESNIHELMSCGMDICPDKGISNYRRYACLSVLTYNMKKVGQLLAKQSKKPPAKTQSKRAA